MTHRRPRVSTLGLLGLLLCTSCAGAHATGQVACEPTLRSAPDAHVFRGQARATSEAEARERARLSALVEALKRLGVEIDSEVQDEWTHVDGADTSRIVVRSRERVAAIEVRGAEVAYCAAGEGAVRAAVAIPVAEWRRLARVRSGRTLLVLRCVTDPAGGCGGALLQRLRDIVSAAGLHVATALAEPPDGVDVHSGPALVALGRQHEAARILWIDVRAAFRTRHEGVLYAYTTIHGTLVETTDGKATRTAAIEDVKGAVYEDLGHTRHSRKDAVQESITRALDELRDELGYWGGS